MHSYEYMNISWNFDILTQKFKDSLFPILLDYHENWLQKLYFLNLYYNNLSYLNKLETVNYLLIIIYILQSYF